MPVLLSLVSTYHLPPFEQEPPVEGDTVVIPFGQSVLLDESPPKLFLLLVQVSVHCIPREQLPNLRTISKINNKTYMCIYY